MGAVKPGGARPGTADLPRGRGRPAATVAGAPSISYDGLDALRRRCVEAEREVVELRKANARLRATAEAYERRAELAESCAKRIFALVARR
jgi:hypothetical protein